MPGFSTQPKANPLSPKLLLKVYFTFLDVVVAIGKHPL
jgi:hypothetical protein